MARMDTRGKRDHADFREDRSDLRFLIGAAIVAIVLVLISVASGVGIAPDASMFAGP